MFFFCIYRLFMQTYDKIWIITDPNIFILKILVDILQFSIFEIIRIHKI